MSLIIPQGNDMVRNRYFGVPCEYRVTDGPPLDILDLMNRDDHWSPGEYSVTELLDSPRCVAMKKLYPDLQAKEEASVAMFRGNCVHFYIQQHRQKSGVYSEQKITLPRHLTNGHYVTGMVDEVDLSEHGKLVIRDYKTWSTFKYANAKFDDVAAQLNIYYWSIVAAMNARKKIDPLTLTPRLEAVVFFMDWKLQEKFRTNMPYPPCDVLTITFDVVPEQDVAAFLVSQIDNINALELISEADWPEPDPEDVWQRTNSVKVYKQGQKRAAKGGVFAVPSCGGVEAAMAEAQEFVKRAGLLGETMEIREDRSDRKRCESYCPYSDVCLSYQAALKEKTNDE